MFSSILIFCLGLLALTGPSTSQRRRAGPQMLTEPDDFQGQLGASITLPCSIRNVGRKSVFWFKGEAPAGRELIMQVKSIRGRFVVPRQYQRVVQTGKLATDGTDLVINDLTYEDSDSYTCSVAWAKQAVTHNLEVVGEWGPGVVSQPSPELLVTYDPPSLTASVTMGASTTFTCNATGYPTPTVTWHKEGEQNVLSEDFTLTLNNIQREDAGRYVCSASNGGVLQDQDGTFDLHVEYVEVTAERTTVVIQSEERRAQLACRVKGYPEPQVVWYTSEGPVEDDDTHIYYSRDDVHYLQLEEMTPSSLGDYQCYVYNQQSRDLATITVQAAPGLVNIIAASPTDDYGIYNITWEVTSLSPIKFYYFSYGQEGSYDMISSSVEGSPTPDVSDTKYLKSTFLSLTPGQTYQVMIRAVTYEHQTGPEMDEAFFFTASTPPSRSGEMSDGTWKLVKSALTVISRLPKVVRGMQ